MTKEKQRRALARSELRSYRIRRVLTIVVGAVAAVGWATLLLTQ